MSFTWEIWPAIKNSRPQVTLLRRNWRRLKYITIQFLKHPILKQYQLLKQKFGHWTSAAKQNQELGKVETFENIFGLITLYPFSLQWP